MTAQTKEDVAESVKFAGSCFDVRDKMQNILEPKCRLA